MRVPPGHLLSNGLQNVCHSELALFPGNLAVEDHLEEDIAQLLDDVPCFADIEGFERFIGFFDQIGSEGGVSLLTVPRATPFGPQAIHEREQRFEERAGEVSHERSRNRQDIIHRPAGALKVFGSHARLGPPAMETSHG